jgi:hypothetical protein
MARVSNWPNAPGDAVSQLKEETAASLQADDDLLRRTARRRMAAVIALTIALLLFAVAVAVWMIWLAKALQA